MKDKDEELRVIGEYIDRLNLKIVKQEEENMAWKEKMIAKERQLEVAGKEILTREKYINDIKIKLEVSEKMREDLLSGSTRKIN